MVCSQLRLGPFLILGVDSIKNPQLKYKDKYSTSSETLCLN